MNILLPILASVGIMIYIIGVALCIAILVRKRIISSRTGTALIFCSVSLLATFIGFIVGLQIFECLPIQISRGSRQLCFGWQSARGWFIIAVVLLLGATYVFITKKVHT